MASAHSTSSTATERFILATRMLMNKTEFDQTLYAVPLRYRKAPCVLALALALLNKRRLQCAGRLD